MKSQIFMFALTLMSLFTLATPFNKAAAQDASIVDVGGTNALGTFDGTFDIQRFVSKGGVIYAEGILNGTFTNNLTSAVTNITNQALQLPVTSMSGSCQILHLELGPVDLDLLGLQIHLDKVVLDITAQSGQGKLLGNLLCGIAGLLDSGSTSAITRLLNQILGLLG